MRRSLPWLAAGLFVLGGAAAGRADGPAKSGEPATCGSYGTSVDFEPSPSEAARRAKKEEKLVFILHVSGLFEQPDFT